VLKTIFSWAQHLILHRKLDEEKSKYAGLAQAKWFWFSIIAEFAVAW
jgi:hypothetical protein